MRIEDRLDNDIKEQLNKIRRRKKNKKKRGPYDNVNYSDLMGINRDRYERRGGSIRRK
ncbi:hypothetical protein [Alkalihalobacillus sp. BA299]|uniref:hypothetical protein n=1 Tax=Alkalihalobacillus sp. BA299 TaxID=2815938 RepID=UPI001ADB27B6|nr:hypothetical protein [Alkalihalobacillus sp. BA299]